MSNQVIATINHTNPNTVESQPITQKVSEIDAAILKKLPPQLTYEKTSFTQLMHQFNHSHHLPPTLELTQAFLMTQNMKETAARVGGLTSGGSNCYLKNDLVVGNLGLTDKASNFMLEQRNLMRAQSRENKEVRDIIDKQLIEEDLSSDEQNPEGKLEQEKQSDHSQTYEDSEEALKSKIQQENRIKEFISLLRRDAKEYLKLRNGVSIEDLSLHKIWTKLKKNEKYKKKRQNKAYQKGLVDSAENISIQLQEELDKIQSQTLKIKSKKNQLEWEVNLYEQVQGMEKRIKTDKIDMSITEIDSRPMTQRSYELQNILFQFCNIHLKGKRKMAFKKENEDIFGKIKKLPQKSVLLQSYQDHGENKGTFIQNEGNLTNQARKKNIELVKVIGLDPENLFSSLEKYKIQVGKMPKFSNVFDRADPLIPGLSMTVAGTLLQSNQGGQMSFARVDGRNVISLQFNPYEINDPQKKKFYDQAVKELDEIKGSIKPISKQAKEKQEQSNIKRAWMNIVKKDIPKAYRGYQKYKADQVNNNEKQSKNCLKEVRKKALKTQRLAKEVTVRAKKLTKEMMNFWKRRDKEIADLKRKKEKYEKEIRRKQEEEKENLLQKKRLEFIMQQSEIYAHFMSKKLGLGDEHQKQRQQDMEEEIKDNFQRVDVKMDEARNNVAQIINTDRSRVNKFDQDTHYHHKKTNFSLSEVKDDELFVEQFDNPDFSHSKIIQAPSCFKGNLKDYQLKGLRWLDNLYEQGINGILADEMGLGKTIQAIVLLAHLAENKQVWGPFLIVVPVTTLHNWQNELSKFCPSLKVLPYFGNPDERKKLGRYLDPKNLYNPNMQINVLLTSYNLLVNNQKDQQKLMRVRWHYMILDEAQAIKNNLSRRWKVLLQFNARNRLLLTGTPIQNSMAELWALLHFIMPRLFDNHEQFQEWFSKDIEQHSLNQGEISKHQLKRLHLVLKPFMLRRLKKDVESEIGPKTEYQKTCEMTHRQKVLYQRIKNKISTKDLFQLVDSKLKMENLMNLVMQFRKVCNHPELFERRVGRIPFQFRVLQQGMQVNPNFSNQPEVRTSMKNPISFELPKIIFDECFLISNNQTKLFSKIRKGFDASFSQVSFQTHMSLFNIFNVENMHQQIFNSGSKVNSSFSILRLLAKSNKWSFGELQYLFVADPIIKQVALMHFYFQKLQKKIYYNIHNSQKNKIELTYNSTLSGCLNDLDIVVSDFVKRDSSSILYREYKVAQKNGKTTVLPPIIPNDLNDFTHYSILLRQDLDIYVNKCQAETIHFSSSSGVFQNFINSITNSSLKKKILLGKNFKPKLEQQESRTGRDRSSFLTEDTASSWKNGPPLGYNLFENGIIGEVFHERGSSILELPNYSRLVTDCAKMKVLDNLLTILKKQNHRCLIFCQMTRMLDILEDFLNWRKFTYFRMDGSTSIQDRRYMVEEFQKNNEIFTFLLSTRAGGIGVNLTGADTVIFYDNDWNPTMDAQATDRAHRIGQSKPVSVYRIITRGTVEERIVKRAKQKQNVQSTVYGGNALKADVFKPKDVVEMLLDDDDTKEIKDRSNMTFIKTRKIKKSKQQNVNANKESNQDQMDIDENRGSIAEGKVSHTKQKHEKAQTKKKEEQKKPKRKSNQEKQQKAPQVQNIFATTRQQPKQQIGQADTQIIDNYQNDDLDDEEEEYDEEIEEAMKAKKLLQLLENDNDEEAEIAFEYDEDGNRVQMEGGSLKNRKKVVEEEDDDDMMMEDEY